MSDQDKEILFLGASGMTVVLAPHSPPDVAIHVHLSERERIILKLPDNRDLALLLSPAEAIRLARALLNKAT